VKGQSAIASAYAKGHEEKRGQGGRVSGDLPLSFSLRRDTRVPAETAEKGDRHHGLRLEILWR
jgi:hypothetical protein